VRAREPATKDPPRAPDFRALDFGQLWSGRARVTAVESAVLREALQTVRPTRVLEIGAGVGRLSHVMQEGALQYAAVDITPEFLREVPVRSDLDALRICADVYHLPFVDAAFPAATLVRVLGFLQDPRAALEEIGRVLSPGGTLVLSYNPHPSVESLVADVKAALRRRPGDSFESMTFSRRATVPVQPSAFPAWSLTRGRFRELILDSGFEPIREWPTGFEDYGGLRRLPTSVFVGASRAFGAIGGFPIRLALTRRSGRSRGSMVDWAEVLACPRCRGPMPTAGVGRSASACPRCRQRWPVEEGVLDLRWDEPSDALKE